MSVCVMSSSVHLVHVDLFQGLLKSDQAESPEGSAGQDIFALETQESQDRWSISENTLYGGPKLSIVSGKHRLHFDQESNVATVWELDSEGWETQVVPDKQQYDHALRMINVLQAVRGHITPIENVAGPNIPDQAVFQQLKSLGYLDKKK